MWTVLFLYFFIAGALAAKITGMYEQHGKMERKGRPKASNPDCPVTASDIFGPYYKDGTPLQNSGSEIPHICVNTPAHDRVFLNGTVTLSATGEDCGKPVRALLDVWQANANGVYSDTRPQSPDFACRTRIFTQPDGKYSLSSIFPGRYNDGGYRPAHIHFRITPVDQNSTPIGKSLVTQLYFAEDFYLSPRDSCQICGSGQPTLIAHLQHVDDIKSFVGTWDIRLTA